MKYLCAQCGKEIAWLETEGDGENRNFVCKQCSDKYAQELEEQKKRLLQAGHRMNP